MFERKRRAILDHNIFKAGDRDLALRRQSLHAQLLDEPRKHLAHEGGESDAGQAVVERLVGDPYSQGIIALPNYSIARFRMMVMI